MGFRDLWRADLALRRRLRSVAAVEPSADLWARIKTDTETHPSSRESEPRFRQMRYAPLLVAAGLLVAVTGAGAVAAQQGWFFWRPPAQRQIGPFLVSGYFYGRMEYYDATGNLQQLEDTSQAESVRGGATSIRVMDTDPNAANDVMVGARRGDESEEYITHDSVGNIRGKLVLRRQRQAPVPNPWMPHAPKTLAAARPFLEEAWQWQINLWKMGSVSVEESPLGVAGYDCSRGLVWSVRGTAQVTVQPVRRKTDALWASTQRGETSTGFGPPISTALAAYKRGHPLPEVTVTYQDYNLHETGFGIHELRNKNGELLLTVTVEPLD